MLSFGDKLIFKDRQGKEVARVEQKLLSIGPTWEVYRDGRQVATVKKSLFSLLHCKFTVDVRVRTTWKRGATSSTTSTTSPATAGWSPRCRRSGFPGRTATA